MVVEEYLGLIEAVQNRNVILVKHYIVEGVDPLKYFKGLNHSPFSLSIAISAIELLKYFLNLKRVKYFVQLNYYPLGYIPPLFIAVKTGNLETIKMLLKEGANPSITYELEPNKFPLIIAVENKRPKVVSLLLEYGANINQLTEDGRSTLYAAASNVDANCIRVMKSSDACKFLIADETSAKDEVTPFLKSVYSQNIECVKLISSLGACLELKCANGLTPLGIAILLRNNKLLKSLLELGADPCGIIKLKSTDKLYDCFDFCVLKKNWCALKIIIESLEQIKLVTILFILKLKRSDLNSAVVDRIDLLNTPVKERKKSLLIQVLDRQFNRKHGLFR